MKSLGTSITSVFVAVSLLAAVPASAMPNTDLVPATNTKSGRVATIPAHAVEVADGVFSLGTAVDPQSGKVVDGLMIVDKKRGKAKGGKKGKPDGGGEVCYAFIGGGAKWKTAEDYIVDPANTDSLSDVFVRGAIASAVDAWDSAVATDVFGGEIAGVVDGADEVAPDGKNEVYFADIDGAGTVGVTIVWGVFKGKPSNRELVEWDQVYDDADYDFGDALVDPTLMDFLNVAVHEVGHAAGLGHPGDGCTEETMYRFVTEGETIKRDLFTGDIAGINALY